MKNILVVEDDILNLELFKNFLHTLGYDVIAARTAQESIEAAREYMPILILMDYRLSGDLDGLEAARIIKSDSELRHIPVVIVTAHNRPGDDKRAYAAGCEGFMVKPVHMQDLRRIIQAHL